MITIDNKEWFDSNGNTYFSADVYLGNDLIMKMPYQYGYSEFCRQVLNEALRKHFNIPIENSVYKTMINNGIKISVTTRNVKKRDLSTAGHFQDFTPFLKPENLALYAHHRMQQGIRLDHSVMENVFVDWLTPDAIGVTLSDGSNELFPFSAFNWF